MAPPIKVTKENILQASLAIVRRGGVTALTAKSLAQELNCSTQPIFWAFGSMKNLLDAVTAEVVKIYDGYYARKIEGLPRFKSTGVNYIIFAAEEPELFRLLFMTERQSDTDILNASFDANKPEIIAALCEETGLPHDKATEMYIYMWLFSHGIATLIVTNTIKITMETVGKALTDVYVSLLAKYKE